jgi:hypothetical protein
VNKTPLLLAPLCLSLFFAISCSRKAEPSIADVKISECGPDGADLAVVLDLKALYSSEYGRKLRQQRDEQEKTDSAQKEKSGRRAAFFQATGLKEDDILGMLITADMDGASLPSAETSSQVKDLGTGDIAAGLGSLAGVRGLFTILLAQSITAEQLAAGIRAMVEQSGGQVTSGKSGSIISFTASSTNKTPTYCALSAEGTRLHISAGETIVKQQIDGSAGKKTSALADAESTIPRTSQLRLAFLASDEMRSKIVNASQSVKTGNSNPMFTALAKPFQSLSGVMAGITLTSNINAMAAFNLGKEQEASSAHTLMSNILIPLLTLSSMQGKESPGFLSRLQVTRSGTYVNISVDMDESDLVALGDQLAGLQAMSEEAAKKPAPVRTPLPQKP